MSIHNIGIEETRRSIEKEKRKIEGIAARRKALGARLLDVRAMKYNNEAGFLRAQRKEKRQANFQAKKTAMAEAAHEKAMNEQCDKYARERHIQKMNDKVQLERHWKMQHRAKATTNPEFDLNDPLALKKDKPARIGDNDPRCGVSSLQMFEGEDLGMAERVKQQEAALRVSRLRQVDEENARKETEAREKRAYEDFVAETTRIRKMNAIAKHRAKVRQQCELARTNKAMARSVREEARQCKAASDALGQLETELSLRNMRLAEDTSVSGQSQLGPNRYRTDHFKGFSEEYRKTFYEVNARQMQENRDIKAAEAAHEASYAAHVANMNAIARQQAADRALRERQADMRLKAERKYHSRVHKAREKQDQDRIMSQKVTDEFLGSFGHLQQ